MGIEKSRGFFDDGFCKLKNNAYFRETVMPLGVGVTCDTLLRYGSNQDCTRQQQTDRGEGIYSDMKISRTDYRHCWRSATCIQEGEDRLQASLATRQAAHSPPEFVANAQVDNKTPIE